RRRCARVNTDALSRDYAPGLFRSGAATPKIGLQRPLGAHLSSRCERSPTQTVVHFCDPSLIAIRSQAQATKALKIPGLRVSINPDEIAGAKLHQSLAALFAIEVHLTGYPSPVSPRC